jgi:tetratricopeptide (TPR) repeat protein
MTFLFANFDGAAPVATLSMGRMDVEALNRRGIDRFARGDADGALEAFRQAIQFQPDDARAWNNSGLVRLVLGRTAEAVADFDEALAAKPNYPEALCNRGRARQALGNLSEARADFDQSIGCASGRFVATVLHNRGALRQELGDLEGARADFDQALEIDPDHAAIYVSRSTVRKLVDDLAGALADLDRALEKVPSHDAAAIYHARGGVRMYQAEFAAAVREFDQAINLDPANAYFYISRCRARYMCYDAYSIDDLLMAFRLDPASAARGFVHSIVVGGRMARTVLADCAWHLRKNNRDALAYARRGCTLVLSGRDAEAEQDFARLVAQVPEADRYLALVLEGLDSCRDLQKAARIIEP